MNQIQCDVAGCQERSPADCGYSWMEVKCGEISNKGVALDYTIKHVCPKCRDRLYDLFRIPVPSAPSAKESGLRLYPDGSVDVKHY